jgi:hypothetical protein
MKRTYAIVILGVIIGVSALVAGKAASSEPPRWNVTMQKLYKELSVVLTDVSSDKRYSDPKLKSELKAGVSAIAGLAHDLNQKVESPDKDPSVIIFGNLFASEAKYADKLLKSGTNDAYAREVVRSLAGYCIACHTRNHTGPDFAALPLPPAFGTLKPIERGEFFAASRQYDRALNEFSQVLADERAPRAHPIEWSNAVKYSLAIAVRVKQDPVLARATASRIVNTPEAPFFLKQDAARWIESIEAWQEEPKQTARTEDGLYAEAVKLLAKAHETQKYPADHAADIYYLRASAAVHDLLQIGPQGRYAGEAYLMAGLCYDVLRSFHIGELHEIYYEACIHNNPHSALAESCFHHYQEAVFEGFTGSGGTNLPDDLKDKLKFLEGMSKVAPDRKERT